MDMNVAQGVGLFAFLIGATAFLQKDGRKFRLHLMVFQVVLCSHFILMGAMVAAISCGISALRSYASTKTKSLWVMSSFIALLWLMGVPQLTQYYELLTLFGASVATYGLFRTQGVSMRLLVLFNSLCWLTNNLLLGSIGGSMMETTFILVNGYTIARLVIDQRTEKKRQVI
ncbi:YgjV family protein [Vibrio tapetis subsp. quintayensis]|uniref:YgjV family protein n=1 Tax=Vibrio tapetis TaxID=52443 RepID=UPI0025B513D7|nr:YgjV family protein [Vibrio tapetis]MDN3681925.1 YgjV family protein [Vibrio tapetis subsp. quintayensis]